MKSLLLVSNYSGLYGSEKMLVHLYKALSDGFSVSALLNPSSNSPPDFLQQINGSAMEFSVVSKSSARFCFRSLFKWLKLLRKQRPDSVLVNISLIPEIIVACFILRIKIIVFVRESLIDSRTLFLFYKPFLRAFSSVIVCNSEYTLSMFGQYAEVVKDFSEISAESEVIGSQFWQQGELVSRRVKISFVGRLSPRKGIHLIPEAISLFGDAGRFHFLFIGDAKSEDKLYQEKVLDSFKLLPEASVEFFGFLKNPEKVVTQSDFLIAPSVYPETFGLVVLEALKVGVPVIAARIGAYPELVDHGYNGFLFNPGDPDSLSEVFDAVSRMSDQEVLLMKERALRSVDSYCFGEYQRQVLKVVGNVVDRNC